jgi:hypothetical protein
MVSRNTDVYDLWLGSLHRMFTYAEPLLVKNALPKAMALRQIEYGATDATESGLLRVAAFDRKRSKWAHANVEHWTGGGQATFSAYGPKGETEQLFRVVTDDRRKSKGRLTIDLTFPDRSVDASFSFVTRRSTSPSAPAGLTVRLGDELIEGRLPLDSEEVPEVLTDLRKICLGREHAMVDEAVVRPFAFQAWQYAGNVPPPPKKVETREWTDYLIIGAVEIVAHVVCGVVCGVVAGVLLEEGTAE